MTATPSTPEAEYLPAHWTDNRPVRWTCRIDLPLFDQLCAKYKLSFISGDGVRVFAPDVLNAHELFDMAFLGSRWNAMAQGEREETREEFLSHHGKGMAYEEAVFAARRAIINFTLERRFSTEERPLAAKRFAASEQRLRDTIHVVTAALGAFPTSVDGASTPDSAAPGTPGSPG